LNSKSFFITRFQSILSIHKSNLPQVGASSSDPLGTRVACNPSPILNFLISMTNLNKLFALTLLMTIINVPMYFYSKTLVKSSVTHGELITSDQGSDHEKTAHGDQSSDHSSKEDQLKTDTDEKNQVNQDMAMEEKPGRFQPLANLYRPPLYGKCKKLFERFNRKTFPDKPYKAFVYSFDGESAYCADAYTDKGQQEAEQIVIRDCEEHQAGSGKYSPCRIYSSE